MKIGLMLPLGEDDQLGRPLSWDELRALAVAAEGAGLDSLWGADHLLFRDKHGATSGIHEIWTVLSAVAAVTSRVEIGPLVLATPFRNPALTAKMAATLDEVSGGRLILGLGCGWHQPEFDAFGYPFDHRVGRFEEALEVMLPLLRTGTVDHRGRWYRAPNAELAPRAPRTGSLPIMIAGKGPRMLRLVARHADQWNAAWYGDPATADDLADRIRRLREACDAEGRDPDTITLTAGVFVRFDGLMTDADEDPPDDAMGGEPDAVGRLLAGYAAHGVEHLIVHLWPRTPAAVAELGRAAAAARAGDAVEIGR
jgi:probable F420-dependent oxidoreductase